MPQLLPIEPVINKEHIFPKIAISSNNKVVRETCSICGVQSIRYLTGTRAYIGKNGHTSFKVPPCKQKVEKKLETVTEQENMYVGKRHTFKKEIIPLNKSSVREACTKCGAVSVRYAFGGRLYIDPVTGLTVGKTEACTGEFKQLNIIKKDTNMEESNLTNHENNEYGNGLIDERYIPKTIETAYDDKEVTAVKTTSLNNTVTIVIRKELVGEMILFFESKIRKLKEEISKYEEIIDEYAKL